MRFEERHLKMQVLEGKFRRGGKAFDRQGNTHKVISIQDIDL